MKILKRIGSTLLAVMLLATLLVVPASAASGSLSITISGADSNREFEAYQIFGGDLSGKILSNVFWGDGVDSVALLNELKASTYFGTRFDECNDASAVAGIMAESSVWTEADTIEFAKIVAGHTATASGTGTAGSNYVINNLAPGYYFVKETTAGTNNEDDAYSRYIVSVTTSTAIEIKKELPILMKKVSLKKDGGFVEGVSAGISNTVYFSLTAQLHSRVSDYSEYKLRFEDTLPASLDFNQIEAVYVNNTEVAPAKYTEYGITHTAPSGAGGLLTVNVDKARTMVKDVMHNVTSATDKITILYSATVLGENLDLTPDGNVNSAVLYYSNNPNPGFESSMGHTASDTAVVHTYKLVINKRDSANLDVKLEGAEFTVQFEDDGGATKYIMATGSNGNYVAIGTSGAVGPENKLTTNANGQIILTGLREREYRLVETKAPTGYNSININDKQDVNITATHDSTNGKLTALNATRTGSYISVNSANKDTCTVEVTIVNNQGTVLPSTGGMGTTLFYIMGTALMLSAAGILLAKKRFACS